jgi:hypothetical protein
MSQLLAHGSASTSDGKQEPSEMYSTNSGDSTLPPTAETLSASDISKNKFYSLCILKILYITLADVLPSM